MPLTAAELTADRYRVPRSVEDSRRRRTAWWTVIGFAIKGLVWLAIIGIVLFLGTSAVGFVRRKASKG